MSDAQLTERNPWPPELMTRVGLHAEATGDRAHTLINDLALPEPVARHLWRAYWPLAELIARHLRNGLTEPLVMGINGAQGTGKSTGAYILARALSAQGWKVCQFSIDDLYLRHEERQALAEAVHPLLATRGVPGTHDVVMGRELLAQLRAAESTQVTRLPSFDKAKDDQKPESIWPTFTGRPDLILFEGWCVGARPQAESALVRPCNELEEREDPDGRWRTYVNQRLEDYQALFAQLDLLVMLQAPSFQQVYEWRSLQEEKLRQTLSESDLAVSKVMSSTELVRFISHYERLTRWMLEEMPARANVLLALNPAHEIDQVVVNSWLWDL
ncbi:phosphoribulokinase [Marinimicrobium sp. ABcell2]|uniref:phosphoribulokinase n=1 Tax=Marinimicrobium sp. ABcell2 TaxID=3069751 RepID=UPI0027B2B5DB|nr:phosphoribulokinase [Marinimicrobium sp. ABcell2]MDQ2077707.1 phosphoribulokinase [Marinimicrobium sp. ABcell2]